MTVPPEPPTTGNEAGQSGVRQSLHTIFQPDGKQYLQQWLSYQAERKVEQYYRFCSRKARPAGGGGQRHLHAVRNRLRTRLSDHLRGDHSGGRQRIGSRQRRI